MFLISRSDNSQSQSLYNGFSNDKVKMIYNLVIPSISNWLYYAQINKRMPLIEEEHDHITAFLVVYRKTCILFIIFN